MKTIFLTILSSIILFHCKNSNVPPTDAQKTSSDTVIVQWDDSGPSIYDSINAPILRFDSASINAQISQLLKFTNRLKRDGATSVYVVNFEIDKNGQINFIRRNSSSLIREDMARVEQVVMNSFKVIEAASLIKNTRVKVDYDVEITFWIRDKIISFEMCGDENMCFLKHTFNRPL
jgi:hypothetical protein